MMHSVIVFNKLKMLLKNPNKETNLTTSVYKNNFTKKANKTINWMDHMSSLLWQLKGTKKTTPIFNMHTRSLYGNNWLHDIIFKDVPNMHTVLFNFITF